MKIALIGALLLLYGVLQYFNTGHVGTVVVVGLAGFMVKVFSSQSSIQIVSEGDTKLLLVMVVMVIVVVASLLVGWLVGCCCVVVYLSFFRSFQGIFLLMLRFT